jgi:hypothetical protein
MLSSFFDGQDFTGSPEILVWDNSGAHSSLVDSICSPYIQRNSSP